MDSWVCSKVKEKSSTTYRLILIYCRTTPVMVILYRINQIVWQTSLIVLKETHFLRSWYKKLRTKVSCWKSIFGALLAWPAVNPQLRCALQGYPDRCCPMKNIDMKSESDSSLLLSIDIILWFQRWFQNHNDNLHNRGEGV